MLISGYFLSQKKIHLRTALRLWLEVWFYSVAFGSICYLIGIEDISIKGIVTMLMPFTFNEYWFFSTYILVYLFSPYFNKLIDNITKKQHIGLIVLGLLFTSFLISFAKTSWAVGSNSITIFIVLYFVGAYIRKYDVNLRRNQAIILSIISLFSEVISIFVMRFIYKYTGINCFYWFIWGTEKILAVSTSLLLFLLFKDFKIKSTKLISSLSNSVFGVYLFHIGRFKTFLFINLFNDVATYGTILLLPQMIVAMCVIFAAGIMIDKIRIHFFENPIFNVLDKPVERLNTLVQQFYY